MPRHLPIYLRTLRKRGMLTLEELAFLYGISKSGLSRIEKLERRPNVELVIGTEVIFGTPPREAFPALYGEIEGEVMRQAKVLYERLERRTDIKAEDKCHLLREMIARMDADSAFL